MLNLNELPVTTNIDELILNYQAQEEIFNSEKKKLIEQLDSLVGVIKGNTSEIGSKIFAHIDIDHISKMIGVQHSTDKEEDLRIIIKLLGDYRDKSGKKNILDKTEFSNIHENVVGDNLKSIRTTLSTLKGISTKMEECRAKIPREDSGLITRSETNKLKDPQSAEPPPVLSPDRADKSNENDHKSVAIVPAIKKRIVNKSSKIKTHATMKKKDNPKDNPVIKEVKQKLTNQRTLKYNNTSEALSNSQAKKVAKGKPGVGKKKESPNYSTLKISDFEEAKRHAEASLITTPPANTPDLITMASPMVLSETQPPEGLVLTGNPEAQIPIPIVSSTAPTLSSPAKPEPMREESNVIPGATSEPGEIKNLLSDQTPTATTPPIAPSTLVQNAAIPSATESEVNSEQGKSHVSASMFEQQAAATLNAETFTEPSSNLMPAPATQTPPENKNGNVLQLDNESLEEGSELPPNPGDLTQPIERSSTYKTPDNLAAFSHPEPVRADQQIPAIPTTDIQPTIASALPIVSTGVARSTSGIKDDKFRSFLQEPELFRGLTQKTPDSLDNKQDAKKHTRNASSSVLAKETAPNGPIQFLSKLIWGAVTSKKAAAPPPHAKLHKEGTRKTLDIPGKEHKATKQRPQQDTSPLATLKKTGPNGPIQILSKFMLAAVKQPQKTAPVLSRQSTRKTLDHKHVRKVISTPTHLPTKGLPTPATLKGHSAKKTLDNVPVSAAAPTPQPNGISKNHFFCSSGTPKQKTLGHEGKRGLSQPAQPKAKGPDQLPLRTQLVHSFCLWMWGLMPNSTKAPTKAKNAQPILPTDKVEDKNSAGLIVRPQ